jgi:hypothetical protein
MQTISQLISFEGWDVSHPNAGQALSDLKADIVFAPTYWIGYDSAPYVTLPPPPLLNTLCDVMY